MYSLVAMIITTCSTGKRRHKVAPGSMFELRMTKQHEIKEQWYSVHDSLGVGACMWHLKKAAYSGIQRHTAALNSAWKDIEQFLCNI